MAANITTGLFYGSRNKRKCIGLERAIEDVVKKHKKEKIPKRFPSRIIGPSEKWDIFYRQQDAFECARSTAKDLHVFAFESETFMGGSGQRMYLVASYPVFWHYYRQLDAEKRNHYEIIPDGAVCKLYFDLEFLRKQNPSHDGNKMVKTLIKYTCDCLESEFSVRCSTKDVLDLDASTDSKFSRHLIFQMKTVAFRNNIHAGKFVCHILSQLLAKIKPQKETPCDSSSCNIKSDQSQSTEETNNQPDCGNKTDQSESTLHKVVTGDSSIKVGEQPINKMETDSVDVDGIPKDRSSVEPAVTSSDKEENRILQKYAEILNSFSIADLQSFLVANKNGDNVLFCDTGVYTKNRNFRLFKSCKMKKNNPLVLSEQNQHTACVHTDEQIFYDSLIANVEFSEKIRVLTFDKETSGSRLVQPSKPENRNIKDTLEGYTQSPYPEIDEFILGLVTDDDVSGIIRHWTYFQQGEMLLYEIGRYRYCHNIGRQHRSNNIMLVADLRKGVYYQKCHDPDCQSQNYRSTEWRLPDEVLPAHYFDVDETDDIEVEMLEDQQCVQAAEQIEKQYQLQQNQSTDQTETQNQSKGSEESLEDDDCDDEFLAAEAEQLENSLLHS